MTKPRALVSVILVLLIAAFILLDFHLIRSQDSVNTMTASMQPGEPGAILNIHPPTTGLYVEGQGGLDLALRKALKTRLKNLPNTGRVTDISAPVEKLDIAVLYVEVLPKKFLWAPFYARSVTDVVVSYASNGDVSFRNADAPHFKSSPGDPVLQFRSTISLADTSWGLVSFRGYQSYLAGRITDEIAKQIQEQRK